MAVGSSLLSWALGGSPSMAATNESSAGEQAPIVIRADRAWEDADGAVLYLEGSFEMSTTDWRVTAAKAEVHGPVENPERVVLTGDPATIAFDDGDSAINGQGGRIVYQYRAEVIELYDDALLEAEDLSMSSSEIVYDLGNERLRSGGADGVRIIVRPDAD